MSLNILLVNNEKVKEYDIAYKGTAGNEQNLWVLSSRQSRRQPTVTVDYSLFLILTESQLFKQLSRSYSESHAVHWHEAKDRVGLMNDSTADFQVAVNYNINHDSPLRTPGIGAETGVKGT